MDYNTQHKTLAWWLFAVSGLTCIMVILGGLVRLTFSGLSMVEWHVVTGVIPPIGHDAWLEVFEKYKQSPEYKLVNVGMSLADFKFIFYMEYAHRMLGRVIGLAFLAPFFWFWRKRIILRKDIYRFWMIGLLLAFQGLFGWYMVQSGLSSQPHVSHYRLTGHLLLALAFLAVCMWTGLRYYPLADHFRERSGLSSGFRRLHAALWFFVVLQIALGGMVAGLRAGTVSFTFPMMGGQWLPVTAWSMTPWYKNFLENPVLIHFIHRWTGVAVLLLTAIWLFMSRREVVAPAVRNAIRFFSLVVLVQVVLGVATILLLVPLALASIHQSVALILFISLLLVSFHMKAETGVKNSSHSKGVEPVAG